MAFPGILTPLPLQFVRQTDDAPFIGMKFNTTAERIAWLSNPTRYGGQIVADLEENNPIATIYVLNTTEDAWNPIISGTGTIQSVTGNQVDNTDILNPIIKPIIEIQNTYAGISTDTYKRLILVLTDETNNNDKSLYVHTGTGITFLLTLPA